MNLYYYLDAQRQKCGPVQAHELASLGVTDTTLVWTHGMDNWQPANQVPELAPYLAQPQPPVPPTYGPNYPEAPASNPYGGAPSDPYGGQGGQYGGQQYGGQQYGGQQYGGQYGTPAFATGQGQMPPMPENNLVWAILATILCCWPIGIYAIVRAAKVGSLYNAGDYDGAVEASKDAKTWSIISAVAGLIVIVIYAIILANS